MLVFERRSRFLWNCLDEFAATYIADRWSWNGPELLTRVAARCACACAACGGEGGEGEGSGEGEGKGEGEGGSGDEGGGSCSGAAVQVEPRESFYPIYWRGYEKHADGLHPRDDDAMWQTISARSYAVHVWSRKTAGIPFVNGSLLHRLHNQWTVLPARENCN